VLLVVALGLAIHVLSLPGAEENGPSVLEMLDARASNDDAILEESLLEDLSEDVHTNEQTLDRKDRLLARAVTLLVFAIAL